ncbi:MAG: PAS domain S-box protein [Chloroflexi bacterium]|nr:PAS domain S-box protein [Chloroflexota bacterium]
MTVRLIRSVLGAALAMTVFQLLKNALFPSLILWQSQVTTIVFVTAMFTIGIAIVTRRDEALHRRVLAVVGERRRADAALQESEEKYHQLFELESDAVCLIDNETGRILDANAAAIAMYGYTRDELLKMRNVDVSAQPDETRRATLSQLAEVPVRYHHRKDGTVFPVEIAASQLNYNGRPAHIAAMRNITARVRADDALRKSEAFNRKLLEASPVGIIYLDQDGVITYENAAMRQMMGVPAEGPSPGGGGGGGDRSGADQSRLQ